MKFSLQAKPKEVLFLQGFNASPEAWVLTGLSRAHIGIDISRGDGDPIYALFNGTVVYSNSEEGSVVYLTDGEELLEVSHGHMKDILVKAGQKVKVGDIVGSQSTIGPSVAWAADSISIDRIAWSHEHLSIRKAKLGKKAQNLKWNWPAQSPIKYHIEEYDPTMDHFRDPNLWNEQIIEKFIRGIANHEGFFNGTSRIAVECKNPGNMRYSPLADGYKDYGTPAKPNRFAVFNTLEKGWAALRRDVEIKATGRSQHMKATDSILKFAEVYAPSFENDSRRYAEVLVEFCGLKSIQNPISDIMLTELDYIRKYNDFSFGWFANENKHGPQASFLYKSLRNLWNKFWKG